MNANLPIIQHQIATLLLEYPELAEDDVLRADMIEGETDATEFLRQIERRRQEATTMAGAIAGNIAELETRQKRFERREQAMREIAFAVMTAADLRKMEMPEATYSVRAGTQKVVVTDEAALPADCVRTRTEPDKTKIKELLAAGQIVPGAILSNAQPSLSVRVK